MDQINWNYKVNLFYVTLYMDKQIVQYVDIIALNQMHQFTIT